MEAGALSVIVVRLPSRHDNLDHHGRINRAIVAAVDGS
jgi:hypothetical protein